MSRRELGTGTFGVVRRATLTPPYGATPVNVAIKFFKSPKAVPGEMLETLWWEAEAGVARRARWREAAALGAFDDPTTVVRCALARLPGTEPGVTRDVIVMETLVNRCLATATGRAAAGRAALDLAAWAAGRGLAIPDITPWNMMWSPRTKTHVMIDPDSIGPLRPLSPAVVDTAFYGTLRPPITESDRVSVNWATPAVQQALTEYAAFATAVKIIVTPAEHPAMVRAIGPRMNDVIWRERAACAVALERLIGRDMPGWLVGFEARWRVCLGDR